MNLNRLLLSGALKPTRTALRGEGLLMSGMAIGGALGLAYHVLSPALVAVCKIVVEWTVQ